MTGGEIGCLTSHMRAIRAAADLQDTPGRQSMFMVFEDDVAFDLESFLYSIISFVEQLDAHDPQWDYFSLGLEVLDSKSTMATKTLLKPGYFYQAHAYLVSKSGASRIAAHAEKNVIAWDEWITAAAGRHPRAELNSLYFNETSALRVYADPGTHWPHTPSLGTLQEKSMAWQARFDAVHDTNLM